MDLIKKWIFYDLFRFFLDCWSSKINELWRRKSRFFSVSLRGETSLPSVGVASDDRRGDVRQSELGYRRDLFEHAVAVADALRNVGARVSGEDGDRLGRVDDHTGEVLAEAGRKREDHERLVEVLRRLQGVRAVAEFPDLDAGVRERRRHLQGGEEFAPGPADTQHPVTILPLDSTRFLYTSACNNGSISFPFARCRYLSIFGILLLIN